MDFQAIWLSVGTESFRNILLLVGLVVAIRRVIVMNKQSRAAIEQARTAEQKQYSEVVEKAFNILKETESPFSPMGVAVLNGATLNKDRFMHLYFSLVDVLRNLAHKKYPVKKRSVSDKANIQNLINFLTHKKSPIWNVENFKQFDKADREEIEQWSQSITFEDCDFSECNFSGNRVVDFSFINCNFRNANFHYMQFSSKKVSNCDFTGAVFDASQINLGIVDRCEFNNCKFNSVGWSKGIFSECDFSNANLRNGHRYKEPRKMQELELLTFESCNFYNSEISEVKFYDVLFMTCSFDQAWMSGTRLKFSRFQECGPFRMKVFNGVYMNSVRMVHCDFIDTNLSDVWLQNSELEFVHFFRGSLFTQNIKGANFVQCGKRDFQLLGEEIKEEFFHELSDYDLSEMKKRCAKWNADFELDI